MSEYRKMMDRHQEEVNNLPLGFAFSTKQYEEMMEQWGLDPEKDKDKIVSLSGCGGYVQKKDRDIVVELFDRHDKEMKDAIAADQTGDGFIYEMFLCELDDHEYGYTGDIDDTLDCLGYTMEEIEADKRLKHGLHKAIVTINRRG